MKIRQKVESQNNIVFIKIISSILNRVEELFKNILYNFTFIRKCMQQAESIHVINIFIYRGIKYDFYSFSLTIAD
jgi:hypothetical protein